MTIDTDKIEKMVEKARQYFPILDWTNENIAEFVRERKLKLHPYYYDQAGNFCVERRVGCIGCPMATGNGTKEFRSYPTLFRARVHAYLRFCEKHPLKRFPSPWHRLYENLFCKTVEEYRLKTSGLFGETDEEEIRGWLENYFGISLK